MALVAEMSIILMALLYVALVAGSRAFVGEVEWWQWAGCIFCISIANAVFSQLQKEWRDRPPRKYRLRTPWERI